MKMYSILLYITLSLDLQKKTNTNQFEVDGEETHYNGENARPYFIAESPSMKMTFNTGPQMVAGGYYSFLGFKAVAKFYRGECFLNFCNATST